jgi:glycosyltransferase involved in cell wall biosynthesis
MPRVLRIINRLNLGGPTYNVAYLTAHLGNDYETLLVAGMKDDTEESSEFIISGLDIKPVYIKNMKREISLKSDWAAYKEIDQLIKDFKPDIVHTHAAKAGTVGRLAAIRNKVPVVLHTFHGHVFQGYFGPAKTKIFLEIERFLAKRTSGIIAISSEQKKELIEKYKITSENKANIIQLGLDLRKFETDMFSKRNNFRKTYSIDDETIAIGIIGRLVPIKNHLLFLKAWKEVNIKSKKKIHAFIIGDGEDREKIQLQCKDLGLEFNTPDQHSNEINLTFTSWIIDIDNAIAGLDIIALTYNNEGTPVSLIEAQAGGKAIVSTNVGGIKDIVIDRKTALLSTPEDVEGFTNNLLNLIEDEELRKTMSELGPGFANENFGFERLIKDMRQLYDRLLRT